MNTTNIHGKSGSEAINNEILLEISKLEKENLLYRQKITELEHDNEEKMQKMQKKIEENLKIKYN